MTTLLIIYIVTRITECAAEMAAEEVRYRIAINKIIQNNEKRAKELRKILSDNKDLEAN